MSAATSINPAVDLGQRWSASGGATRARRKPQPLPTGLDAAWADLAARGAALWPRAGRLLRRAQRVIELHESGFAGISQRELTRELGELRPAFRRGRETPAQVDCALALVREACEVAYGFRAHCEQVAAALATYEGCLVEMATGEGKTLATAMGAVLAAWRGRGCHVITANDYLAARDAAWAQPIYAALGLSCAAIAPEMTPPQRRWAYRADITYVSLPQVTADELRDQVAWQNAADTPGGADAHVPVLRGLHCAIIDEADAVFIDEGVTPLILSAASESGTAGGCYECARDLTEQLEAGRHFQVEHHFHEVSLTAAGVARLDEATSPTVLDGLSPRRRNELVRQAIAARELYRRDEQYVVHDGRIVIVDMNTGRPMPDRTWRLGLHQAIEAKERLPISPPTDTTASISFQRFLRSYERLGGMSGTLWEARHELHRVYGLPTVRIPSHQQCRRVEAPDRWFASRAEKMQALIDEAMAVAASGRPVLIGTRHVGDSEWISSALSERGCEHAVLNARHHADEAAIIARAGAPGSVTVATNVAGRGTDIKLTDAAKAAGGLHVIAAERHESRRVDRQLFGRAGRQGDPGSALACLCPDDELFRRASWFLRHLARTLVRTAVPGRALALGLLVRWVQWGAARRAALTRADVQRADEALDTLLSFAVRGP